MKTIGIIGGIAPASTVDYYLSIVAQYQQLAKTNHYPSILINSINMTKMLSYVAEQKFDDLANYLLQEIEKLKSGGAEFAILASNTPHIVFDKLKEKSPIPLISIVEATISYAKQKGFVKLGLFGTRSTMQSGFYQNTAAKENLKTFLPETEEQNFIHNHYMDEFVKGIFREEIKSELVNIARKLKRESKIEALILGGTEIPLILKQEDLPELELINTTKVHVDAVLRYAMNK